MVYVIPILITLILGLALKNKIPVYEVFIEGVQEGFRTVISILPALVAILSASAMLRQSGAIAQLSQLLSPVTDFFKIPSEILPLALIRPLSGGGSLALLTDTVNTYGADSLITRTACILCASTETTFYTLMVYFGPTGVKYTRRVLFAALFGDLAGILCAAYLGRINF